MIHLRKAISAATGLFPSAPSVLLWLAGLLIIVSIGGLPFAASPLARAQTSGVETVQDSSASGATADGNAGAAADGNASSAGPVSLPEARIRARLLHETIAGVLQVMHRDFFDEDDALAIPSASLEDVFHELARDHGVEVKWLVVNTDVVNVDHQPADDFERRAVKALAAGDASYDASENGETVATNRYRFAGAIHLRSQCLKCHVKRRLSNEDRVAGLAISIQNVNLDSANDH